MLKDFKKFVLRGNVMDMAIGVILGSAFGKIVSSFVSDILMPVLGLLIGKVDFKNLFIVLGSDAEFATVEAAAEAGVPTLNYGIFINQIIDYLLITISIFLMVRAIEKMRKKEKEEPAAPDTKECPFCCSKIPLNATRCPNCTSVIEG